MAITTSSSLNVCVTIGVPKFSIGSDCHISDPFSAQAPFDGVSWRLLVYPRGSDDSAKGYVTVQLEMDMSALPLSRRKLMSPTPIVYKVGIVNSAFKVVDHVLHEDDFGHSKQGRLLHFLRQPIVSGKEADQVITEDTIYFRYAFYLNTFNNMTNQLSDQTENRVEITYPESLLRQILPVHEVPAAH